ncbi:uncharacterized protein LOC129883522 [Solanum dulcamara]|uniref:uncharacterized protein LOC129883522 n=1 Tax=Solanum dulcamara TaxID=45834 RepID=UPI0024857F5D|nr:uncharacterized protein LOC129883522 [Solanum dulcamara]
MPPRGALCQRGVDANKGQAPQAPNDLLADQVTHVEFRTAILMLAQAMTTQVNQGVVAIPNVSILALRECLRRRRRNWWPTNSKVSPKCGTINGRPKGLKTIPKLMNYAEQIEGEKLKEWKVREFKRDLYKDGFSQPKFGGGNGRFQQSQRFQGQGSLQALGQRFDKDRASNPKAQGCSARGPTFPKCTECGRNHEGKCLFGSGACFGCGKIGYKISECPNKGREGHHQGQTTQG